MSMRLSSVQGWIYMGVIAALMVGGCGDDGETGVDPKGDVASNVGLDADPGLDIVTDVANDASVEADATNDALSEDVTFSDCLTADPAGIDFGIVEVGDATSVTVRLENVCDQLIYIQTVDTNAAGAIAGRLEGASNDFENGNNTIDHALSPLQHVDVTFVWEPRAIALLDGMVFTFFSTHGSVRLDVSGEARPGACASARIDTPTDAVPLGQTVVLDGNGSVAGAGGPVTSWAWTLTPPEGSTAALDATDTAIVRFTPDVAGPYTVTLAVEDQSGVAGCETVARTIVAGGDLALLTVTLSWSTESGVVHPAGSPPPDPNLHLAHPDAGQFDLWGDAALEPWYDIDRDAFYFNDGRLDWGVPGDAGDDPSMGLGDQSGPSGAEDIWLETRESWLTYRIGVDRYKAANEHANPAPIRATVRVAIGRVTVATFTSGDLVPGDFWEVATVVPATGEVIGIDTLYSNVDTGPHFRP